MCHGIIREYCSRFTSVSLFCRKENYTSVQFMYRDLKNLNIIKGDDDFARYFIKKNGNAYNNVKIIGFEFLNRKSGIPLEKQFYSIAGVNLDKLWSGFDVKRDLVAEMSLYKKVSLPEKYIILHEDSGRGFHINRDLINKKLPVFEPKVELTQNIFDYCTIIEKAAEIHVIDSSFMFLIDRLHYDNPNQKLFIHRYARENYKWKLPILAKKWHIYLVSDYKKELIVFLKRRLHEFKINLKNKL